MKFKKVKVNGEIEITPIRQKYVKHNHVVKKQKLYPIHKENKKDNFKGIPEPKNKNVIAIHESLFADFIDDLMRL